MTDPHDLDELASAHLDGATTPEEAARVETDPVLRARVEELRSVRDAVADVPPVDRSLRDDAIATALAAFDEDDAPVAPMAPVTQLAPRRGLSARAVRAVSAAAVIVLLALLVPLLANVRDQDQDDEAAFDTTSDDIEEGGATSLEDGGALQPEAAAGDAATGGSARATLGSYDDLDELAAALAAGALAGPPAEVTTTFQGDPGELCRPTPEESTIVAFAVVAGAPVEVYVRTDPDGTRMVTVLADGSCELLDEREL